MHILILNGPNLNLLGRREPALYGTRSFESFLPELQAAFPELTLAHYQSSYEGSLIDRLHAAVGWGPATEGSGAAPAEALMQGIVLNAGGYTHSSVALADAVAAVAPLLPVVEVHLTNLAAREDFRQKSLLGRHCAGSITGFGLESYRLALHYLAGLRPKPVGFRRG